MGETNPDRLSLVYWTEPGLRVVRLRLLSDPGYPEWDVSYCHGYVGDEPAAEAGLGAGHRGRRDQGRSARPQDGPAGQRVDVTVKGPNM